MAKGIDLEFLKDVFRDDAIHITLAVVKRVEFTPTGVFVTCDLVPETRQIIATMAWDSVGADSGSGDLPELNDLVLVCFADRENDHAFIVKRLTSAEETLPLQMKDGHFVTKAKPGKNLLLGSDTRVEIGKASLTPATEPLVLGAVLLSYLTALEGRIKAVIDAIDQNPVVISTAPGTPALVSPVLQTALTLVKTGLDSDKATYLTATGTNIVSQTVFTER